MSLTLLLQKQRSGTTPPVFVPSYWNPSDSAAGFTFSNNNQTVVYTSSTNALCRSVTGHPSTSGGKYYAEIQSGDITNALAWAAGITLSSTSLSSNVPTTGSTAYIANGTIYIDNTSYAGTSLASNDIIMIAVDFSTMKVWFGKNGVWLGSGDPATGVGEIGTIPTQGTYHLLAKSRNFTGTKTFILPTVNNYPIPAGFSAWG